MGESTGHPFRGNQWTKVGGELSKVEQATVRSTIPKTGYETMPIPLAHVSEGYIAKHVAVALHRYFTPETRKREEEISVPISKMIATQKEVSKSAVSRVGVSGTGSGSVKAVEKGGKFYIWDGHHRVTAFKLAGKTHINARVIHMGQGDLTYD